MDTVNSLNPHFMDARIINPILNGTIDLFHEMLFIEPTYGEPFIVKNNGTHRWEISGIIGVVGDSEGIVVLRVTNLLAEKLLMKSQVIVKDETEKPKIINEMISELVNIISAKALGGLKDFNVKLTPPFTVQGKNHEISWPSRTPIIGVPFQTPYGPFEVEVSISSKTGNAG
ncbi:MAG: chemotaxis protein CheX [Spirochaetales bacterium]|nr:chemotaxis protein CheX [Spirochaetales bacterium]